MTTLKKNTIKRKGNLLPKKGSRLRDHLKKNSEVLKPRRKVKKQTAGRIDYKKVKARKDAEKTFKVLMDMIKRSM